MTISISQLLEESFQIAWEYLERTGELGDGAAASRFLSDTIETMIRQGQRSRLVLSNRAISAYLRFRSSGATGSRSAACSSA
jgi:type IV secretory pathway TrbF-like protein